VKGTVRNTRHNEEVPFVRVQPAAGRENGTVAVWLAEGEGGSLFTRENRLTSAAQKLIDAGVAIVSPSLYLPGAKEQPRNPVRNTGSRREGWRSSASYTYGYNHPLLVHR